MVSGRRPRSRATAPVPPMSARYQFNPARSVQPRLARIHHRGPHATCASSAASLDPAALAFIANSFNRSNLASSSGFTPRIVAAALFRRHCESQPRTCSFCCQRAVLARVTAHIANQSVGSSGLGTTEHMAFISRGSSK